MTFLPALLVPALIAPALGADPQPLELTLDDCIRLALANNLSMQTSRLDAEAAVQDFNAAWGAFDTIYFLNATAGNGTRAPSTSTSLAGGSNVGTSPATTTEDVSIEVLAGLARTFSVPLVFDAGSGATAHLAGLTALPAELPSGALSAGADLVCFSGDKLLGGPQAGILIGKAPLVSRAAKNPLARALRPDKLALAALAATLDLHLAGLRGEVPLYRMLGESLESLSCRASSLAAGAERLGLTGKVADSTATAGGGSGADSVIPSRAVALEWPGHPPEALAARLRHGPLPVVGRIEEGRFLLDLRTVAPEEDAEVLQALESAIRGS